MGRRVRDLAGGLARRTEFAEWASSNRTKVQSGTTVGGDPFTVRERERVDAMWRLTALPRAEFEATYGVMLGRLWRFESAPQGEAWTELKAESLACTLSALRACEAHMLPRFARPRTRARLTEVMSFALTTAVVAERFGLVVGRATAPGWCALIADVPGSAALGDPCVPCSYGALLLPRLAGDAGLA